MRSPGVLVGVSFVVACGAVLKPPAPDRRLNIKQTGSVFESSNGYQFAVIPEPGATVVRLDVRYPVGAAHDPSGKEGLAHLVEHLLFEVEYTRGADKTSISAELGRHAVSWNAETHADYTSYQTVFPRGALDQIIGLEVNRISIGCGGLTPEIFAREREVVVNELRQRQGASGAQLQRVVNEALYPAGHPYRAVDSVDTVAKLQLKDVCDFLANQYQQGKAIIVASGDVDEQTVQQAAGKQFMRLRKRNIVERARPQLAKPQPGTVTVRADIDEASAVIATWPLPPMGSSEYRLLSAVWPAIGYRVEQFAFTYKWGHTSFTEILGGAHAPVLAVGIYLNSASDADEAKSSLGKSVRFALDLLGHDRADSRWQAKVQYTNEAVLARWESLASRNEMVGDMLMFEDTPQFLIGRLAELKDSSPSALRELAGTWLTPGRARYLIIEPSGTSPVSKGLAYGGGAAAHATAVDGSLADQVLPMPKSRRGMITERYELDNGLKVILWPNGTAPIVRARLVIDSGAAHDPAGKDGVSYMVGADDVTPDALVFERRELANLVDDLVSKIGAELRMPGLPVSDEQKDFLKSRLRNKRTEELGIYEHNMLASVYGEKHPYARFAMTPDSVDKIHHDLVQGWARSHVVAKNATLVIAGQFDAGLVKKHIAYNVDQVGSGSDSPDIDVTLPAAAPRFVTGIALKPSPTVQLDVYFLTARGMNENHAKRLVLEEVLDAELSSLRNKQALTYGFSAGYSPRKGGGLWWISGEADAGRAGEAATSLVTTLDQMRANPEAYRGSFVLARQKVLERLVLGASDSLSVTEQLASMALFDLDDEFFDQLAYAVSQLTLQDFHAFFVNELPANRQVFGAFGNVAASQAAVTAAKQVPAPSTN
jgi:zinc protease